MFSVPTRMYVYSRGRPIENNNFSLLKKNNNKLMILEILDALEE